MITDQQLSFFKKNGFLIISKYFNHEELIEIDSMISRLSEKKHDSYVYENDGITLRSVNGPHLIDKKFEQLPKKGIIDDIRVLLDSDVYIHQYKINFKSPLGGDVWPWHSDFYFWNKEDGMLNNNALSVAIALDDITEFNAPMFFVPGSHIEPIDDKNIINNYEGEARDWRQTTSAKLKYELKKEFIEDIVKRKGIFSAKAEKGAIIIFHSSTLHASGLNLTPYSRRVVFLSFNDVKNKLPEINTPRPLFMATR
ncbi:ectoine hydroxylase [Izhakiella capsodis]|uniref:Ectoine hydroxylase n=1 Tax=Izhakiella capsodis TaxID=1367852 RepID=A0A1I4Y271_9GAMM|nr:phytanoyl-CoA dioxygenase family protein [Izhakiella capsodis]SFN32085.1 ectoine hydroxylase [Izhakiella capsodis]